MTRILLLGGAGLAMGSAAFLVLSGYRIADPEFWWIAIIAFLEGPEKMLGAMASAEDGDLFGGIFLTILGAGLAISGLLLAIVKKTIKVSPGLLRVAIGSSKAVGGKVQNATAAGWRLLGRLKRGINRCGGRHFKDDPDPLGEGEKASASLFTEMGGKLSTGITEAARRLADIRVQDKILDIEGQEKSDIIEDVFAWYKDLNESAGKDPELIGRAGEIQKKIGQEEKRRILERDPENGDFLIRIVAAWAEKNPEDEMVFAGGEIEAEEEAPESRVRAGDPVVLKAIRDVSSDRTNEPLEAEEETIDLESEDSFDPEKIYPETVLEDEESGRSDPSGEDELAGEGDRMDDDEEGEAEEDESGENQVILVVEEIISEIEKLEEKAYAVREEGDVWPDGIGSPGDARRKIEALFETLERERENLPDDWESRAGNISEPWRDALSRDNALNERRERSLEEIHEEEDGGDEDEELGSEFLIGQTVDPEENAAHEARPGQGDTPVQQDQASTKEGVSGAGNVSVGELEEIELCEDLILRWGHSVKQAGAAEARIVHAILEKEGLKRKVVGVLHLVARWRGQDIEKSRQLGIIFRYVPEGSWLLDRQDGIWLKNTAGDQIGISQKMIESEATQQGKIAVHFHGPGAPDGLMDIADNIIVSSRVMSVEEITHEMGSSN